MKTMLSLCLLITLCSAFTVAQAEPPNSSAPAAASRVMRELDWDTYLDKVQGVWLGKTGDTARIGLKVLLANGGEVVSRSGRLILRVPQQEPLPPSTLEQVQWNGDKPVF